MKKGYNKASLRSICVNAGVTTGALYFFFKDKGDLYKQCIGDAVDGLYNILQTHFNNDNLILESVYLDFEGEVHSKLAQIKIFIRRQNND